MGFMWSSPKSPLKETLLNRNDIEPIKTGDLLLIGDYSEDMCIGDFSPWVGVAIIFDLNRVYDGNSVYSIHEYIQNWSEIQIRYYNGIRYYGFDKRLQNAVKRTVYQMTQSYDKKMNNAYGVAYVLKMMGIIDTKNLSDIEYSYFSSNSNNLKLKECYSENKEFFY